MKLPMVYRTDIACRRCFNKNLRRYRRAQFINFECFTVDIKPGRYHRRSLPKSKIALVYICRNLHYTFVIKPRPPIPSYK